MTTSTGNLILIGGPVVNSVTAALAEKLEVPSDYDGWKEEYGTGADSGVVKYVAECGDINGYGVVLVAGTDREGTAAAAKALMEYLAGLS
ncbi:S-layer protein [Thermococcus celericrescens]|uniref:S-layer protein n=1 Tax=Thermococcus celericrescens TaxID=227598 RepID=UPI001FDFCF00|nr:S-layer protein [Thermococcus celericrescens]